MSRIVMPVFFQIAIILVSVSSLYASEGSSSGGAHWLWPLFNFAILVTILIFFLKKPIRNYFNTRTELMEKSLNEAKEAKALAQKALDQMEERVRLKDSEVKGIIEAARDAGEREKERLINEGKAMSLKIKDQAEVNISFELKKAKDSLKAEAVEIALEMAEKELKSTLTEEQQEKLLDESVKKIASAN